jgi:[ribosomal protein S5]-alanine N-acetyltransferase
LTHTIATELLQGPTLRLREFTAEDWAAAHEWGADPAVSRFQAWGPNTPEDTQAFVGRVLAAASAEPRTDFTLIAEQRETGEVVGTGSIFLRSTENRTGEIAYALIQRFWRRGFGTELGRMLLRIGFEYFALHRIYATCDPRNLGSSGVMKKNGMLYEGRRREDVLLRDGWRDSDLYAILESEWRSGWESVR